jgi:hypothetical protein
MVLIFWFRASAVGDLDRVGSSDQVFVAYGSSFRVSGNWGVSPICALDFVRCQRLLSLREIFALRFSSANASILACNSGLMGFGVVMVLLFAARRIGSVGGADE